MLGAVLYEIQKAGFQISAIQSVFDFSLLWILSDIDWLDFQLKKFNFTKPNAEEFLEVYKGVIHEYPVIFFL